MRRFTERLQKIERQRRPTPGLLPTILVAPDGPEGDEVRAQAERLRAQGHTVILIADDADRLNAAVDWLETLI